MRAPFRIDIVLSIALACLPLTACGLPEFAPGADTSHGPADGPTVTALIENLKCELWEAANDTTELSYDKRAPIFLTKPMMDVGESFTVRHMLAEIEYIASVKLTLDVTNTATANPSINFIKPYSAASTNLTLAVGGQLSDASHRSIDILQSVDFARFVPSNINHKFINNDPPPRKNLAPNTVYKAFFEDPSNLLHYDPLHNPCSEGAELTGNLGLKEVMQTAILSAKLDDFGVRVKTGGSSKAGLVFGQTPIIQNFDTFAYGQVNTQIDFAITTNLNGGPNWTIKEFKGPTASNGPGGFGQGLLNLNRVYKDTLFISLTPVCIRQQYFPTQWENYRFVSTAPAPGPAADQGAVTAPPQVNSNLLTGYNLDQTTDQMQTAFDNAINNYKKAVDDMPKPPATDLDKKIKLDAARKDLFKAANNLDKKQHPGAANQTQLNNDLTSANDDLKNQVNDFVSADGEQKNTIRLKIEDTIRYISALEAKTAPPKPAAQNPAPAKQPSDKVADLPPLIYPAKFEPPMVEGTPEWAHYLPSCVSTAGSIAKSRASDYLTNYQISTESRTTRRLD